MLRELGAVVLDADKVGHSVYRAGTPGFEAVVAAFGPAIIGPDGEIDRKKLGAIVFADPAQLEKLNQIVHPLIRAAMLDQLAQLRREGVPLAVIEAAILIEAGWTALVDEVWVAIAPLPVVVQRVRQRNNLTEEQVLERVRAQLSEAERLAHADVVIDTNCSLDELRATVRQLWQERVCGV
jgi:dephospho-CoA kinase